MKATHTYKGKPVELVYTYAQGTWARLIDEDGETIYGAHTNQLEPIGEEA